MANQFNWSLGHEGKGNVYADGLISTWNTRNASPHHYEVGQQDEKIPRFHFYISPEGGLWDGGTTFNNQTPYTDDQVVADVVAKHPAVWDGRHQIGMDWEGGDWDAPEERVEMPGGGFGHADALLRMTHKLASSGWADFHTEFKIPRGTRKQIRRWVDRLKWPEGSEKMDAREYHITVLDMDKYDEDFAKWARKRVQGKTLVFKSQSMDLFNEFVVVRLECPVWDELARDWTEEAERRGLEPHTFPGGPKAHISVGKSPNKKWPQGIPNPHVKFETRMFNIKRNSVWHEASAGDPWQPGAWGKGMFINGEPKLWETTSPHEGEMVPIHYDYSKSIEGQWPSKHDAPIVISPSGEYAPAPHWGDWSAVERGSPDPLIQREWDEIENKFNTFSQMHPSLRRVSPDRWSQMMERGSVPYEGYGHGRNVLDILERQAMAVESEPVDDLAKWFDSFSVEPLSPPSLHHTDGDDFMPQIVAPVVNTPHIDPPKKPYKPYNWAEEGWEESPLNRTAGVEPWGFSSEGAMGTGKRSGYHIYTEEDDEGKVETNAYVPTSSEPVGGFRFSHWCPGEAKPHGNPAHLPMHYWENEAQVEVDPEHQRRGIASDMWDDFENYLRTRYPNEEHVIDHGGFSPEGSQWWNGYQGYEHEGNGIHYAAKVDSHECSRCGSEIDAPICSVCGYDPQNSSSDYKQMKNDWYERAWSRPGDQPQPVPHQPHHWRDDHAKDITLARKEANDGYSGEGGWWVADESSVWGSTNNLSVLRDGKSHRVEAGEEASGSSMSQLPPPISGASSLGSGGWHGF